MGVNGHDVSRHALEIVKADPPASDHQLARETGTSFEDERTTGRAGRTTSLAMLFFVHDARHAIVLGLYLSSSSMEISHIFFTNQRVAIRIMNFHLRRDDR